MKTDLKKLLDELTDIELSPLVQFCIAIGGFFIFIATLALSIVVGVGIFTVGLLGVSVIKHFTTGISSVSFAYEGSFIPFIVIVGFSIWSFYITFKTLGSIKPGRTLKDQTLKLYELYRDADREISDIQTILESVKRVHSYIRYMFIFVRFGFFFSDTTRTNLKKLIEISVNITHDILADKKADLVYMMEKQSKTIDTARDNLISTLGAKGPALAQQARLDKQIEQFEELQRVLVKI